MKFIKEQGAGITAGFMFALFLSLLAYGVPRSKAYANAIRVAHNHKEVVESLEVPEKITKEGNYKITLSK